MKKAMDAITALILGGLAWALGKKHATPTPTPSVSTQATQAADTIANTPTQPTPVVDITPVVVDVAPAPAPVPSIDVTPAPTPPIFLGPPVPAPPVVTTQPIADPVPVDVTPYTPPIVVTGYGIQAASPNVQDVQAAIDRAAEGDTVHVPAGRASWASPLTNRGKYVHLVADGTVVTNDITHADLVQLSESPLGSVVFQGFDFHTGAFASEGWYVFLIVDAAAGGRPVIVRANAFDVRSNSTLRFRTNRGLITRNHFLGTIYTPLYGNNGSMLRHKPGDAAPYSWTTRSYMGADDVNGDQNLYVEDNVCTMLSEGIDVDDNGRTVVRHNTFVNSAVLSHGNDTSGTGARSFEAYRNQFVYDRVIGGLDGPQNVNGFVSLRGGTAVIWENDLPVIDSGGWWGVKPGLSFFCENLRRNAGPCACWRGGYPIPHQVGRGMNDTPEPVYVWGNTGGGNYDAPAVQDYAPNECGAGAPSAVDYIQNGRDFLLDTLRPNYAPFTYPHPLA